MRDLSNEELVEVLEAKLTEDELAEWNRRVMTALLDTFEAIRTRILEEAYPAFVELVVLNGCRQPEALERYHEEVWALLEANHEAFHDLSIFSTSSPTNEADQAAEAELVPLRAKWEASKQCRLYQSRLLCYCDEL